MPEPIVYDARAGLSQPALDDLSRASRLDLAAKSQTTTVIGCWVRDPGSNADAGDELRAIVLDGDQERGGEGSLVVSDRLLQQWGWPEVVGRLQVGDRLRAKWVPDGVVLEVDRAADRFVLLSLHSASGGGELSGSEPNPSP